MDLKPLSNTFTISDLETLKVISEPLRAQVLELLLDQPMTVRQTAEKLGLSASKLYYHINLLEKHGLLQVVETRQVANLLEKVYRATARNLEVDPSLLNFSTPQGQQNIHAVLTSAIDATRDDLIRSLQARHFELEQGAPEKTRLAMINRLLSRLSEAQARDFLHRLNLLMQEFDLADTQKDEDQTFALTVVFYPSFYFPSNHSPK